MKCLQCAAQYYRDLRGAFVDNKPMPDFADVPDAEPGKKLCAACAQKEASFEEKKL